MEEELERFKEAKSGYSQARARMNEAEADLDQVRKLTYEKYVADRYQMELFKEGKEAGNE